MRVDEVLSAGELQVVAFSRLFVAKSPANSSLFGSSWTPRTRSVFWWPQTIIWDISSTVSGGIRRREDDPVIGNDTFEAFEYILRTAREMHVPLSFCCNDQVDFLLLGGDLFDANKPSRSTLNKTIELLNKYCLGSGDIDFTYLPTDDSPLAVLWDWILSAYKVVR